MVLSEGLYQYSGTFEELKLCGVHRQHPELLRTFAGGTVAGCWCVHAAAAECW